MEGKEEAPKEYVIQYILLFYILSNLTSFVPLRLRCFSKETLPRKRSETSIKDPAYTDAKRQNTKSHKTNIKHSRINFAVKKVTSCLFR